jgi:hypothetical protein
MTKLALARPLRGQPRFFAGRYEPSDIACMTPVTTGQPDRAKTYQDRAVAEIVAAFLNVLDGIHTGTTARPWIIMELPEAWT